MFSIFSKLLKKQSYYVDFSRIGVDIHSHLVPGVDDGAKNVADSMSLIKGLKDLGFKKLITTPHTYQDYYPNTTETLKEGFKQLQLEQSKHESLSIEIECASEYFMDEEFEHRLRNKDILTIDDKHVLVEISFYAKPMNFHNHLFQIQTSGYIPVLAHPERYLYFGQKIEAFIEAKERGCKLQLNFLSLTGHYGDEVKALAELLLKENLYDFAGTDCHHERHIQKLQLMADSGNSIDISERFNNHLFLQQEV